MLNCQAWRPLWLYNYIREWSFFIRREFMILTKLIGFMHAVRRVRLLFIREQGV